MGMERKCAENVLEMGRNVRHGFRGRFLPVSVRIPWRFLHGRSEASNHTKNGTSIGNPIVPGA